MSVAAGHAVPVYDGAVPEGRHRLLRYPRPVYGAERTLQHEQGDDSEEDAHNQAVIAFMAMGSLKTYLKTENNKGT